MAHFVRPEVLYQGVSAVVAQDDMKRKLVSVVSQYSRYLDTPKVGRPVVMVFGESGTGKTFAIEQLSKASGLPFTVASSASLAVASYKGLTPRDLLAQHYMKFGTDEGIIFLDEIDKRCHGAIGSDSELISTGLQVQAELLRLIESESIRFVEESEEHKELENVTFRSNRVLWIFAGAFTGMEPMIRRRLHNIHLTDPRDIWKFTIAPDFHRYGMLPELANRIGTWAWVFPLERQEIMEVVRRQEVPRWIALFTAIDCTLTVDDGAMARCADLAFEEKTGARGAMSYFRRSVEDIFVEASRYRMPRVHVDARIVLTGKLEIDSPSVATR